MQIIEGIVGCLPSHYHCGSNWLPDELLSHVEMSKCVPGPVSFDKEEGKKVGFGGGLEWCLVGNSQWKALRSVGHNGGDSHEARRKLQSQLGPKQGVREDFIYLFSRNLTMFQNPLSHWECTGENGKCPLRTCVKGTPNFSEAEFTIEGNSRIDCFPSLTLLL